MDEKNQNLEIVTNFINEYTTQNNCGTRYPIYFVIRDSKFVSSYHFEDGEKYTLYYDGQIQFDAESLKELFKLIEKDDFFSLPEDFDIEDSHHSQYDAESVSDFITETKGAGCSIFAEKKEWVEKGMFLLQREAKEHLEKNHYHYSKDAHVYCQHAWRAPETEGFFEAIAQLIKEKQ